MRPDAQPPAPPNKPVRDSRDLTDVETDNPAPIRDMRKKFARVSKNAGRDPEAERAFAESKIEMIRSHPTLTESEKHAAIAELEGRLGGKQ